MPWPLPADSTCRKLLALAQSLSDLAPALTEAIQNGRRLSGLSLQFMAACLAITGMERLARGMTQLPSQAAFAISAACSLIFGPGAALLGALSASQQPDGSASADHGDELYASQLAAALSITTVLLHHDEQPQAAVAFAASTGKPSALMPWLVLLCHALPAVTGALPSERML